MNVDEEIGLFKIRKMNTNYLISKLKILSKIKPFYEDPFDFSVGIASLHQHLGKERYILLLKHTLILYYNEF